MNHIMITIILPPKSMQSLPLNKRWYEGLDPCIGLFNIIA